MCSINTVKLTWLIDSSRALVENFDIFEFCQIMTNECVIYGLQENAQKIIQKNVVRSFYWEEPTTNHDFQPDSTKCLLLSPRASEAVFNTSWEIKYSSAYAMNRIQTNFPGVLPCLCNCKKRIISLRSIKLFKCLYFMVTRKTKIFKRRHLQVRWAESNEPAMILTLAAMKSG